MSKEPKVILSARGLAKSFQVGDTPVPVFSDIDLDLMEREMLMLVGASGTGKSTLLHILGAMDSPDCGAMELDGIDMIDLSERKRSKIRNSKIGFIFQFFHLLPEFTALENVMIPALYGRVLTGGPGKKIIRDKAEELLSSVGLSNRASHKPSQLSGGQMQRVAFARALINDPAVVFADEPTGNLDEDASRMFFDLIEKFNSDKGKTFLIATHNRELAMCGSRVLRLHSGELMREK